MTIRVFSDEDLERLRSFPEINREELIRFFTLTAADVEFVDPGRGRGPGDRLGLAVQLCTLPWLGFVPDKVTAVPSAAVTRLGERLGIDPAELQGVRAAGADPDGSSAVGGRVSGVEAGAAGRRGDEGAGAVPAGPGDGA